MDVKIHGLSFRHGDVGVETVNIGKRNEFQLFGDLANRCVSRRWGQGKQTDGGEDVLSIELELSFDGHGRGK